MDCDPAPHEPAPGAAVPASPSSMVAALAAKIKEAAQRASSPGGGGGAAAPSAPVPAPASPSPAATGRLPVLCNGVKGWLDVATTTVACGCAACAAAPPPSPLIAPAAFERHAGLAFSKKWRATVRVAGGVGEAHAPGEVARRVTLGEWLAERTGGGGGAAVMAGPPGPVAGVQGAPPAAAAAAPVAAPPAAAPLPPPAAKPPSPAKRPPPPPSPPAPAAPTLAADGNSARARRKPGWLATSVDPFAVRAGGVVVGDGEAGGPGPVPAAAPPAHAAPPRAQPADAARDGLTVVHWRATDAGTVRLAALLDGRLFAGELAPQAGASRKPAKGGAAVAAPRAHAPAAPAALPTAAHHPQSSSYVHPLPADPAKAAKVEARRAAVDADYVRRAAARAPPHDAACTMCGRPSDVAPDGGSIEASHRGAERAMGGALGPLILVRASAISVVWCHEQCAAWSPEVFLDDGGRFAAVEDACRRGRMIKCRACGAKGATLGCISRTCRLSYHLPCARAAGCALSADGVVVCPAHAGEGAPRAPRPRAAPAASPARRSGPSGWASRAGAAPKKARLDEAAAAPAPAHAPPPPPPADQPADAHAAAALAISHLLQGMAAKGAELGGCGGASAPPPPPPPPASG
jgi:hypothetical protein